VEINGVVTRSKDRHEAFIDSSQVGGPCVTLENAITLYCREMQKRGVIVDRRTVMAWEYMPNEPVYKLLRIR
jgi:Tfp pilus assembly protein PilX